MTEKTIELFKERRDTAQDLRDIIGYMHAMDTRVAVLESRMNGQDTRLAAIEMDGREIKISVQRVLELLDLHTKQEDRDRMKLMGGIIAVLLSVLGFIVTTAVKYWLG